MSPDLRLTTRLAVDLLLLTAAIAAGVHFLAADRARELLGFGFAGVPHDFATATSIFGANLKTLAAVLAACLAVHVGRAAADTPPTLVVYRAIAWTCDGTLLVVASIQVLVIGAAYGAYGFRTVEATAAHGPFELAAFSSALALYISVRCEPLGWPRFATTAAAAVGLLAVGAAVEAYV